MPAVAVLSASIRSSMDIWHPFPCAEAIGHISRPRLLARKSDVGQTDATSNETAKVRHRARPRGENA